MSSHLRRTLLNFLSLQHREMLLIFFIGDINLVHIAKNISDGISRPFPDIEIFVRQLKGH